MKLNINGIFLASFCVIFIVFENIRAASTSPSQVVPKVFEQIEKDNIKKREQENLLKDLYNPQENVNKNEEITVLIQSIVIISPKELQKVIDFRVYEKELVGKTLNVESLNTVARKITQEYKNIGYPLVRVILPRQELKPKGATVFFKVISGFIGQINLKKVPKIQRKAIYRYLRVLKNKKNIKNSLLERQLLLANQVSGLKLNTAFTSGETEGASTLLVEAKHKLISSSVQFNNTQSEELGRQLGILQSTINSPFGYGESITLFGLSRPTIKGMKGTGNSVTIRGGGASFSYPLGNNGLKTNFSYSESMTRPGGDIASLGIESNMKSGAFVVNYPIRLRSDSSWTLRGTVSWTDEIQQTNASGIDTEISHDRLTSLRVGLTYFGCSVGCIFFDSELSRGLDIASRSASEATTGTPLSRVSGTSQYNHIRSNSYYSFYALNDYLIKVGFGGQYTDDGLLNSEQSTIIGEDKISSLTSGAISGDKIWYVRGEISRNFSLLKNLSVNPYLYSAIGVAYINKPTAAESKETAAKSVGFGLILNNLNNYFSFNKNISAKVEYSKTIATDKIEILSDVRLNKHHLMLLLNMSF